MKTTLFLPVLVAAAALSAAAAQTVPPRPRITGISHIAVYTSDPAATEHYYTEVVGAVKLSDPEDQQGVRYALSETQYVEALPLPAGAGVVRLDHVAWVTESAEGMRKYLAAKRWKVPAHVQHGAGGSTWFEVRDPEGNKVQFVEAPARRLGFVVVAFAPHAIGHHIIHVGYMVHDRALEDTFYRDLLGFRPYWWGGRGGKVEWVAQQCPDGHDWMEYMVTRGTSGMPADMTQRELGVMDHFSIGVVSVPDAVKALVAGNRLDTVPGGHHDAAPKIGLDGKYQFNMYDPDGIRTEVMNFHATEKPCCSPFTAEDPPL